MNEPTSNKKTARELWDTIKFVALAALIVIPIRMFVFQPFIVSGESMYPTFNNADYLIIDELSYHFKQPERGQVIVFKYPNDPSRFFIKRIIGLPGETIMFKDRSVFIKNTDHPDGIKLDEPYLTQITIPGEQLEVPVTSDHYFVMGDNRGFSSDSRAWGLLPRENITGTAKLRLLPVSNVSYNPGSVDKFKKTTTETQN
jgi:signal peptidase I